ncbi:MAG TPA: hypothetical protein DGR97_04845, partial [Gammaproteobacteria bacterium]|nr:hypothetical protein [Gammaproteobacteria bacterium]
MKHKNKILYIFSYIPMIVNLALSDSLSYYEHFNIGVQYYKERRYKLAFNCFSNIYLNIRNSEDPAAQLFIAKSLYQLEFIDDAKNICKALLNNFPNSPYDVDIYLLLGDIALEKGKVSVALQNYLYARPLVDDLLYVNDIDNRIYSCIGIGLERDKLEMLLFREKNPFNRSIINLARSYQNWVDGNIYDVEIFIKEINPFFLPGRFANLYGNMKKYSKMGNSNPITIAVLIPLSGINKDKGYSYLLGLSEYLDLDVSTNFIRFIVYDTGGSAIKTLDIMNNLELNKNISAVLGPITTEEIFILAGNNSKLPVLVPMSASPGLSDIAENLFFLSPSYKTIA